MPSREGNLRWVGPRVRPGQQGTLQVALEQVLELPWLTALGGQEGRVWRGRRDSHPRRQARAGGTHQRLAAGTQLYGLLGRLGTFRASVRAPSHALRAVILLTGLMEMGVFIM